MHVAYVLLAPYVVYTVFSVDHRLHVRTLLASVVMVHGCPDWNSELTAFLFPESSVLF